MSSQYEKQNKNNRADAFKDLSEKAQKCRKENEL